MSRVGNEPWNAKKAGGVSANQSERQALLLQWNSAAQYKGDEKKGGSETLEKNCLDTQ